MSKSKTRIPPVRNYTIDLTILDGAEQRALNDVISRDLMVNKEVDDKVSELKNEIQSIRKAGALTGDDRQSAMCARCKYKFWLVVIPFVDHGTRCFNCKFKVCRKCRYLQANNLYLCSLCLKQRQEKWLTGEWLYGNQCRGLFGSDLLRASLRDKEYFAMLRSRLHATSWSNLFDRNRNKTLTLIDETTDINKTLTLVDETPNRNKTLTLIDETQNCKEQTWTKSDCESNPEADVGEDADTKTTKHENINEDEKLLDLYDRGNKTIESSIRNNGESSRKNTGQIRDENDGKRKNRNKDKFKAESSSLFDIENIYKIDEQMDKQMNTQPRRKRTKTRNEILLSKKEQELVNKYCKKFILHREEIKQTGSNSTKMSGIKNKNEANKNSEDEAKFADMKEKLCKMISSAKQKRSEKLRKKYEIDRQIRKGRNIKPNKLFIANERLIQERLKTSKQKLEEFSSDEEDNLKLVEKKKCPTLKEYKKRSRVSSHSKSTYGQNEIMKYPQPYHVCRLSHSNSLKRQTSKKKYFENSKSTNCCRSLDRLEIETNSNSSNKRVKKSVSQNRRRNSNKSQETVPKSNILDKKQNTVSNTNHDDTSMKKSMAKKTKSPENISSETYVVEGRSFREVIHLHPESRCNNKITPRQSSQPSQSKFEVDKIKNSKKCPAICNSNPCQVDINYSFTPIKKQDLKQKSHEKLERQKKQKALQASQQQKDVQEESQHSKEKKLGGAFNMFENIKNIPKSPKTSERDVSSGSEFW